jgi:hypothetical protein
MKMSLKDRLKRFQIPLNFWTVGGISLVLVLVSYAILSPNLRYYLDDWPQLYSMKVWGLAGIKQYFLYDGRPFGYWPDYLEYLLFGTNPLLWHLTLYLIRWLTTMFMWATFVQIWPKHKVEISWATLLFAIYPVFMQMSISVTFTAHYVCYLFFFISTYLMVLALRKRKYFWPLMILAVLFDIANLFTYEYFVGVEFLRPFMIWFVLREEREPKLSFWKVLAHWIPYLATSAVFIIYRIFLIQLPKASNSPSVLGQLFHQPVATIILLIQDALKDTIQVILEIWHTAFNPDLIDFTSPALNIAWGIVIIAGLIFLLFAIFSRRHGEISAEADRTFTRQALGLGLLGVILGCAPGWSIGRTVSADFGLWNDRFALGAMFAAALFIIAFFFWVLGTHYWRKVIIVTILVALAAGQNFRVTNDFRWSSTYQNRFAYQLSWRAPSIQSPTAIFADNEMFTKMGVYPTSFMLNLLYPNQQEFPALNYWFFTLNKYFPDNAGDLANNIDVNQAHWYTGFDTTSQNSLVISWHPESNQCLWVLTENDLYNPQITDLTKKTLGATNLKRISTNSTPGYPDASLFGKENKNQWCYYFEKGDLDRQQGNWADAVSLYDKATGKGFTTDFGVELMPFIEAYAHQGDGQKALELTKEAAVKGSQMREYICDNWIRIAADLKDNASIQSVYKSIYTDYSCAVIGQ